MYGITVLSDTNAKVKFWPRGPNLMTGQKARVGKTDLVPVRNNDIRYDLYRYVY